jgi:hypothetical protein
MRGHRLDFAASDYKQMFGFCRHVNALLTPTICFSLQSALRQSYSFLQSQFSAQLELLSHISFYSIFPFPLISSCLRLLPRLPVIPEGSSYARYNQSSQPCSFYCMLDIPVLLDTLNLSSFLTRSIQMIFPISVHQN